MHLVCIFFADRCFTGKDRQNHQIGGKWAAERQHIIYIKGCHIVPQSPCPTHPTLPLANPRVLSLFWPLKKTSSFNSRHRYRWHVEGSSAISCCRKHRGQRTSTTARRSTERHGCVDWAMQRLSDYAHRRNARLWIVFGLCFLNCTVVWSAETGGSRDLASITN